MELAAVFAWVAAASLAGVVVILVVMVWPSTPRDDRPAWNPGTPPDNWSGDASKGWIFEPAYPALFCYVTRWDGFMRLSVRRGSTYLFEGNVRDWDGVGAELRAHLARAS